MTAIGHLDEEERGPDEGDAAPEAATPWRSPQGLRDR
jgi:hypothetical protein